MAQSRLVVIDNLSNNTSAVIKDFNPTPSLILEDGHQITELWYSEKIPSEPLGKRDFQKEFDFNIKPGALHFIRTIFPPFSQIEAYAKEYSCQVDKKNFGMHSTTTIDFAVVLKGQMEMSTENGMVKLKTGDCLVQKATIHGWINTGEEPAEMIFVMVGAHVPESFQIKPFEHPVSGMQI